MADDKVESGTPVEEPEIGLDTQLQESEPFLGEILVDEFVPGEFGQQWHQGIRPLEHQVQGKTGMLHNFAGLSSAKNSKMGALIEGSKAAWGTKNDDGSRLLIGRGQLVGKRAWFKRVELKFRGRSSELILPFKKVTDAEIANAKLVDNSGGEVQVAIPTQVLTYDVGNPDVIDLLTFLDGKTPKEAGRAVLKTQLPQEYKNAVMNGTAVKVLSDQGLISVNNGTIASSLDSQDV